MKVSTTLFDREVNLGGIKASVKINKINLGGK